MMLRDFKFLIQEVEGLYNLCSEYKGTDKLCSYCAANLRLCFRICKRQVFSYLFISYGKNEVERGKNYFPHFCRKKIVSTHKC